MGVTQRFAGCGALFWFEYSLFMSILKFVARVLFEVMLSVKYMSLFFNYGYDLFIFVFTH